MKTLSIQRPRPSIDLDSSFEQRTGEVHAGELAALVGVENFRLAVFRQGLLPRLDAKRGVHCVRQPPR